VVLLSNCKFNRRLASISVRKHSLVTGFSGAWQGSDRKSQDIRLQLFEDPKRVIPCYSVSIEILISIQLHRSFIMPYISSFYCS
jgi:hypothetical protein